MKNVLKVSFFKNSKEHAYRYMYTRPMVGDIVILRDGSYRVTEIIWPFREDRELDYLQCNAIIELV